ncbi:MAG: hypothetical protein K0U12_00305, partial [Gammaproteobacteria bacterium]|nr:hypothetical protein [Gammaproteobacteria bacterium]
MSRMSSRKLSAADVDDIFARNLQSYLGGVSRVISGKPQYLDHMVDFGLEVDLATAVYGIDLLYAYFFVSKSVLHRYIVPARVDRLNRFFSKLHLVDRVYTSNHYPTDVEKFCGPGTAYTEFMKETPAKKFDEIYKRIIQQQSSGRQRANNITLLMLCCMLLEAKKSLSLLLTWSKFKQTFNKLYSECKDEAAKKSFNKLVGDIREKRTRKGKSRLFWNRILDFKHGIYFLYGDLVYQVRRYMSDHPFYKILADHWVKKCVNDPGDNLSISYSEKGDVEFEISPFFGIDFLSGKVALSLAKSV